MKRVGALLVVCAFAVSVVLASAPTVLVRVERQTRDDLATLRAAGLPVVMEMSSCLILAGDEHDLAWLEQRGWKTTLLGRDPAEWDHWIVGLRPDADRAAVESLGDVLHAEENWLLLRVPLGTKIEALAQARVFVTRVGLAPLVAPPPGAGESAGAAAFGPPDPFVQKIVGAVSPAQIDQYWSDLTSNPPTGSRYSQGQGCRDAAAYCLGKLQGLGLPAEYQNWNAGHAPNVIGTQRGAVNPDEVYIVIGHLDDLPSSGAAPGADDNASGTVNVLESARAMSCWGFRNTVKYIACTGEEQGLLGSDAYAQDAQNRGENIQGVINMDMIAWEGNGVPNPENLDLNYNTISQPLGEQFAAAATTYGTGLVVDAFYCPSLSASDHYPFWQRGWKALCGITDNEGYCGHGGNYPYYHTSNDTIPNCGNKSFFYSVIKTSVATLAELGEPFKITFEKPTYPCSGGTLRVYVADRGLNTNPAVQETVVVPVSSNTESAPESVVLTEDGVNSMNFSGSILTTTASPVHGDGMISVAPDDVVTTRYTDAVDCDGATNVEYTATAVIDCSGPAITNVGESGVSDIAATINWTTNELADGRVVYGPSIPPTTSSALGPNAASHHIPLSNLSACTVYYYEVRSTDPAGNAAVDNNGGQYHRFETLGDFGSGLQPCHAGRVSLNRSLYGCSGTAQVKVIDIDLNQNSSVVETIVVRVSSTTELAGELLTLTETSAASSSFVGTITLAAGPPAPDGQVQVAPLDTVTATYHDADDGSGALAVSYATAVVDCAGPTITNLAVTDQPPGRVLVSWNTSEPSSSRVDYGPTTALGQTVSDATLNTAHSLVISSLDLCGVTYFKVSSTDAQSNTTVEDRAGRMHRFQAGDIPGLLFYDNFESSSGWTLPGEWQIDQPRGLGGSTSGEDPTTAWSSAKALGTDLTGLNAYPGDYEPNTPATQAESPQMNARDLTNVKLMFRRWLGVDAQFYDKARVLVYKNGWTSVWSNPMYSSTYDGAWVAQSLDISTYAAGNSRLRVAFSIQSNATNQYCGWNIDDVVVKDGSLPDSGVCGGCTNPPSFGGLTSAKDANACQDTGAALSWQPAAAWGSGGPGTYSVHRDTTPNFTPSSSNRIATGISATSYNDPITPNGVTVYYLVRAENGETCSTGPHNGGVTDDNTIYLSLQDSVTQPTPGDVGPTLAVRRVADAHVRLTWTASANASSHRVYRADTPQMTGAFAIGETAGTLFEDLGEATTATSRYYLVKGVNLCGAEGP